MKEEKRREEEAEEKKESKQKRKKKDRRSVLYIIRVENFLLTSSSKKYFAFSEIFVLCKFISYLRNTYPIAIQKFTDAYICTYFFSSYNRNEKEIQLTRS